MAKIHHCKTKTLYQNENFGLDDQDNLMDNLNTEDFKSFLSIKSPKQEEVDICNKTNSHKTGKALTIVYLKIDMEISD